MSITESELSLWAYEASTADGKSRKGEIEATDEAHARRELAVMSLYPITLKQKKGASSLGDIQFNIRKPKVKTVDVAFMARQLADSQSSGISMSRSLAMLGNERGAGTALGNVVRDIHQQIAQGSKVAEAFASQEHHLGELTTALISAGEEAGGLDESLARLADLLDNRVKIQTEIKAAATYPAIVLGMAFVMIFALLLFVVPTFRTMFAQLGGQLPLPTRIMLNISDFMRTRWYVIIAGMFGAFYGVRYIRSNPTTRARLDAYLLRMPKFGPIIHDVALSRIAATLSMLLSAAVPLTDALDLAKKAAGNKALADALEDVKVMVEREGRGLAAAINRRRDVFPERMYQTALMGEDSGHLDDQLRRYATQLEHATSREISRLTTSLEPILMVGMGVSVGAAVVAIYLPMFKIADLVQ